MMIEDSVLDGILPVPELEELKTETIAELEEKGFCITNFNSGGIFCTILMILFQIRIELVELLRKVLNRMFVSYADGTWLDLIAADFSVSRKQATKTRGILTARRTLKEEGGYPAVVIPKGTIFKTPMDINGEELRYFSVEDVIFPADTASASILIEAEKEGSSYNVPVNQIQNCLMYIEGIDEYTNQEGWVTGEGSDTETDASLRSRLLNIWSELATRPTAAKYKSVCEAVEGVLYVTVDDMHPRGQGTVDIIVTSTAGEASKQLLDEVRAAAETIIGSYDNLLVKSAEVISQDVTMTLVIPLLADDTDLDKQAETLVVEYFRISGDRELNRLVLFDLMYYLKSNLPIITNIKPQVPDADILLESDKVIILGNVVIKIERN